MLVGVHIIGRHVVIKDTKYLWIKILQGRYRCRMFPTTSSQIFLHFYPGVKKMGNKLTKAK